MKALICIEFTVHLRLLHWNTYGYMTVVRHSEATLAPFCSSCLQSRWHGERSKAGLHTKLNSLCSQLYWTHADCHASCHAIKIPWSWVCFAVLQLCQCATDSRRHWLKLIEGAGLSLIAHTESWPDCLCCCLGLLNKLVINWQDSVLMPS